MTARMAALGPGTGASVHVARQPIHDARGGLYGYELLFRRAARSTSADQDDDGATTATILAAFSEFDVDQLLGGRPGFINLTKAFLVGDLPLPFAPEVAVLEVIESVQLDQEVVAGALRLTGDGYRLALDDFVWTPQAEPLLAVADIAKLDVLALSWDEVLFTAEKCRKHNVRLLAEKVEDGVMLQRCLDEGFELFQGYFLGRPETMTMETLSPGQTLALELVGRLGDPGTSTDEIELAVRRDPALVYRLLRIANTAGGVTGAGGGIGGGGSTRVAGGAGGTRASDDAGQVSTVRDALALVGPSRLRAWLLLLSLPQAGGATATSMIDALARARTCERVARAANLHAPDVAFTAGLLTGVAESLGLSPPELLERMPALSSDLADALLGRPGQLRTVLDAVIAYEKQDLVGAASGPVSLRTMADAYLGALAWTTETARATDSL